MEWFLYVQKLICLFKRLAIQFSETDPLRWVLIAQRLLSPVPDGVCRRGMLLIRGEALPVNRDRIFFRSLCQPSSNHTIRQVFSGAFLRPRSQPPALARLDALFPTHERTIRTVAASNSLSDQQISDGSRDSEPDPSLPATPSATLRFVPCSSASAIAASSKRSLLEEWRWFTAPSRTRSVAPSRSRR